MNIPYIRRRKNGRYQVRPPGFLDAKRNQGTYQTEAEAVRVRDDFLESHGYRLDGTQLVSSIGTATDDQHIKKEERQNTIVVEATTDGIKTLDQLLDAGQVDLDVWRVERWVLNKWPVGAKAEQKDLTFTNGVMDGYTKSDGLTVAQLFQVKAWLVRKDPIPLFPTVQPIQCNPIIPDLSRPQVEGIKHVLVFGDLQIGFSRDLRNAGLSPFHDRCAMDLCVRLAAIQQPETIVFLGDLLDMTEWTDRFLRMPEFTECTQPALVEAFHWFSRLRAMCPHSRIVILEGNHDRRMKTAIVTHLRAAYDLRAADELDLPPAMSLPRLLALASLGIEWIGGYPDNEFWLSDAIRCVHGDVAQTPGGTSKTIAWNSDYTTIYGHIHRREWVERNKNSRDGVTEVGAFSPGCLCHIDGRVPGHSKNHGWQQGAATVEYSDDLFNITPIRFKDGRCIYRGRMFTGEDSIESLNECYPSWNW